MLRVLFVCTGNICRSPTAEAVLRQLVRDAGLSERVEVRSAGTQGYHVGQPADRRSVEHARRRGYDLQAHRARQVSSEDFSAFDYVIAMDRGHEQELMRIAPDAGRHKLALMMRYGGSSGEADVPDPYYGGSEDFEQVLNLVERAGRGLLADIAARLAPKGSAAQIGSESQAVRR